MIASPCVFRQVQMDDISADVRHVRGLPCVSEADHGGEERAEPELHGHAAATGCERHRGPALVRLGAVRYVSRRTPRGQASAGWWRRLHVISTYTSVYNIDYISSYPLSSYRQ